MAGDTISYRQVLIEKVEMKSRPTRGILVSKSQGRNQTGDVVFEYIGMIIAERRTPSDGPAA
jgi:acyl dehydratase